MRQRKRPRQQELFQSSTPQRFWPCPVCNRSFALVFLDDHVNHCLDSSDRSNLQSSSLILPSCSSSSSFSVPPPPGVPLDSTLCPISVRGSSPTTPSGPPLSPRSSSALPSEPSTLSSTVTEASELRSSHGRLQSPSTSRERIDQTILDNSAIQTPPRWTESCPPQRSEVGKPLSEAATGRGRDFFSVELEMPQANRQQEFCRMTSRTGPGIALSTQLPQRIVDSQMAEASRTPDVMVAFLEEEDGTAIEEMRDGNGRPVERPPPGFKIFQRQVQSQARLSMFRGFSSSATLQRKPTTTVLQPGMVLFRSWLNLETQQKLVQESQRVVHLFHRPVTSGGGKYHIYSMCWGSMYDSKAHRYVSKGSTEALPVWMFELSQKLARDAQQHTPVYPPDAIYTPDVALVNFYPVKADELGVVGLGGHQDLDECYTMPVVSVSVGDSMTFFYRRLPPLSRRRSGISVNIDEHLAKDCQDGDAAHNREHQLVLESGDVLVFGGQSRLVYHGTRNVQPGSRPPGLHMVPGRLNFTFRQT